MGGLVPRGGASVTFCRDSQEQVEDVENSTTAAPGASDKREPDNRNIAFMLQLGLTKLQPPQQIPADHIKTEHNMSPLTSGNGPDIQFENPSPEELSLCDAMCDPKAASSTLPAAVFCSLPTKHMKLWCAEPSNVIVEEGAPGTGIVVDSAEDTDPQVKKHDKTISMIKQKFHDRSGQSKPKKRRSASLGMPFKVIATSEQTPQDMSQERRLRRTSREQKKMFLCPQCPETFVYEGNLLDHINRHTRKKVFQCLHCKTKFSNKRILTTHIQNIHP
ncbi:uncharacterized protein [Dermacentor albipictus]|uniref:uncharacterized protein n=1 Tax=Dermacentor albipictus TaxID=60249 RepID=UPI0038FC049F